MSRTETDNGQAVITAGQANAVANLPPELAILRMENETIQSLAAAHPRNHKKIRDELLAQIDAYPSFAREVIYSKPVGRDEKGQMKFARGLSVRAAEAIAEAYGYCRVRADITPLPDGRMKIEATFVDYQRGRIWQDSTIVSPMYKAKGGRMAMHPEDRFLNVILKAEKSKLIREVIVRSVPPGLRSELMEATEQKLDELLDDKTVEKIVANFASIGVSEEMLSAHLGRSAKAGWVRQDRQDLLGLWNAIKSEETTVAEAFGDGKKQEQAKTAGAVSGADLTGAKATAEQPKEGSQDAVKHQGPSVGQEVGVTKIEPSGPILMSQTQEIGALRHVVQDDEFQLMVEQAGKFEVEQLTQAEAAVLIARLKEVKQ